MKSLVLILLGTCFSFLVSGQQLKPDALDILVGDDWKGELTYLDYSSNENVSIPVELTVGSAGKGKYRFDYRYPDEPKANSSSRIKISADGRKIAGNKITKIDQGDDGKLVIHAEAKGSDNNEKAMLYFTYTIGKNYFSSRKEVFFLSTEERLLRNEYVLKR
jgi:hypothetical protein